MYTFSDLLSMYSIGIILFSSHYFQAFHFLLFPIFKLFCILLVFSIHRSVLVLRRPSTFSNPWTFDPTFLPRKKTNYTLHDQSFQVGNEEHISLRACIHVRRRIYSAAIARGKLSMEEYARHGYIDPRLNS